MQVQLYTGWCPCHMSPMGAWASQLGKALGCLEVVFGLSGGVLRVRWNMDDAFRSVVWGASRAPPRVWSTRFKGTPLSREYEFSHFMKLQCRTLR